MSELLMPGGMAMVYDNLLGWYDPRSYRSSVTTCEHSERERGHYMCPKCKRTDELAKEYKRYRIGEVVRL